MSDPTEDEEAAWQAIEALDDPDPTAGEREPLSDAERNAIIDASLTTWLTPDELARRHARGRHEHCPPLLCDVAGSYAQADEHCKRPTESTTPAEPDAGDVEPNAVRRIVGAWDCCGTCAGGVLASLLRKAGDERAEQIAQAIEAKYLGPDSGRGYDGHEAPDAHCRNAYDEGLELAARIARESR